MWSTSSALQPEDAPRTRNGHYTWVSVLVPAIACVWFLPAYAQSGAHTREIENVAAFARLYGVVRFFYPSDAAASVDRDRFAVDGVARVRTASDRSVLASRLRELVAALGPGIEIGPTLSPFRTPAPSAEPLVAWRYFGAGATDLTAASPYTAKRTNRARRVTAPIDGFAQSLPAQDLRGKPIRLRAQARATTRDSRSGGALWLRVDRPQGQGFFDNMGDRPVRDASWREYSIVGTVADDATNVAFGVMVTGSATAEFNALELSTQNADGSWRTLPIKDGGFEADSSATAWNRVGSANVVVTRLADKAPEGRQFVRFVAADAPVSTDELFPEAPPAVSDHIDVDLGAGLEARVALTLTDSQAKAATSPVGSTVAPADLDGRLADVVVAWNFYRHFYPYFAEAAVDWDERLQPQLLAAYDAATRTTEADALRRLVADARDGHGRVNDLRQRASRTALPLLFALIDSRVVVMATRSPDVPVGSVVSSIDGVSATERFATAAQLASGTTQWRQTRAAQDLASCTSDRTTARLEIERDASTHTVDVPCVDSLASVETRPAPVTELTPGIWYVDLTRARKADLTTAIGTLATASAVVFDVRGYPTDAGAWLLPHLIDAPEHDRWMHVPKMTGPFGQSAGWQSMGWDLQPIEPRLKGRIVLITDGRAISYAESVMGYIADRHLATIVGGPTAGANGNVATFTVPGGFRISFTGMRVTGHDGHTIRHLVGIKPDIAVSPTIPGLRAGTDEVLERTLSLIR
jgi:hypothetical protein